MKRSLLLFLVLTLVPAALIAAVGGRDLVREAEIERELQAINPALVEPFRNARVAMDKGDYATTVQQLGLVRAGAPEFAPALRRLGAALAQQGQKVEGIALIEHAMTFDKSGASHVTLASTLAYPAKGQASAADRQRALAALRQTAGTSMATEADVLVMTAQLTLQLDRREEARVAVAELAARQPDLMQTHYFVAIDAAMNEQWGKAAREIRRAENLGLSHEAAQAFLDSGVQSRATAWQLAGITGWVVLAWAAGLIVLFTLGVGLSKATLRQVEAADPTVAVTESEQRLRRTYRSVLNVAGAYYYVSLPVVLLLVIGVAAAVVIGCLMMGYVPIKLVALVVIGAIATVWSMGRSLLLRVKPQDPGRVLVRAEAEALWRLTEEVARDLGTRPIDEIRLTAGTDLCVYERGTWREKLDNRAKRVLVLGVAVLNGFKLDDFRSVLAHEYGHFANRDTAGGDIAMRVQNDMIKFYYAMVHAGQASWLNVAFHFLRLYHFLFRRISHGATRLQEVLADRVAAQTYGAPAFEGGLRHVIRQSIEFGPKVQREVDAAVSAKRPLQNFYDAAPTDPAAHEAEFERALNRPTTEDDTHPGPRDRFRLVGRVPRPARLPSAGLVWDLFKDREAILREMTTLVEKELIRGG